MNLKNLTTCAELRSEDSIESKALFIATRRSYSPRACGLMPNNDRMVVLLPEEAEEFSAGVLRDVEISQQDKWAIAKLIACWLSGEIKDEAYASRD